MVLDGPSIHQDFAVQETDRVLSMSGSLLRPRYEATLRTVYEAATTEVEFTDHENVYEAVIRSLTMTLTTGNRVNYAMELRVCRKIL